MAELMARHRHDRGPHDYPRTARLNELILHIVAEEVELIDDERLELATVVAVESEPDLRHAIVYASSLRGEDGDAEVVEGLADHRKRIQKAIGRQARFKRVPELEFRKDEVTRGAARIEKILRDLDVDGDSVDDPEADSGPGDDGA
jgi:ribosome-binding factor A